MLGRAGRDRSRWTRAALALAAFACALPFPASPYESVPLAALPPSPVPADGRRLWFGARVHRDWERFEITLSDGSRHARRRPADRFAGEVGLRIAPRVSASAELTSLGLGTAVQLDLLETPGAKLAAVLQADLLVFGPAVGVAAGLAASAAGSILGARIVPFARVDWQVGHASLERGVRDGTSPYNQASRWEGGIVSTAGVALALRRVELAVAGGWRAVVATGAFDETRPADPLRRSGAYAIASARWVVPLARAGG